MLMKNFQNFLENSHHFWQTQWNTVWEWFGNDEFNMIVWGTFIITTATFWIIGLCFLLVDLTGKPEFILKYRIQYTSTYPITLSKFATASKQILFNQFVIGIPISFLYYHLLVWRGYDSRRTLPTIQRIASELAFLIFLEEILFYYFHRLLHIPLLFKHIHKVHHKWNSPIAIIAEYCHPVEHVICNLFPLLLGPFLLGSHLATIWVWLSIGTISTLASHSGFEIPLFPNPADHDLHHMKPKCNYGIIGLMDKLHGTQELPSNIKAH